MKVITARYGGRCYTCQGRIRPGEPIVNEGRGINSHERCAGSQSTAILLSSAADEALARIWRNRRGRCEDAPCCGCCD